MNKSKDPMAPGGPLNYENLFKELFDTKNACILELNNVSEPVQIKIENHINYIDNQLEWVKDNQQLINRLPTPEMKQWERYERKTDIDERHYQSLKKKFQPKDPLGDSDFNPANADRLLKEIDLFINPPKPEKLTYKKAKPLLKRLLDNDYSMTEDDDAILSNKPSFKGQRSKFMNKMRMKENFKTAHKELLKNKKLSFEKFNSIIKPQSQYYAEVLQRSFIIRCNRRNTDFNMAFHNEKVYIRKRRLREGEPKIGKFFVLSDK